MSKKQKDYLRKTAEAPAELLDGRLRHRRHLRPIPVMNEPSKSVLIFGYGSLMSLESLRAHVPTAKDLRTAYIKEFRREFSKWDKVGWESLYSDLAGIPFCAVDIIPDHDRDTVNGVIFSVEADYLPALRRRELDYQLVETPVYDFDTGKPLGNCFVFSANTRDGEYVFNEPAQERYIQLCLAAAKEYGDKFYDHFLTTTYIGDKPLSELSITH